MSGITRDQPLARELIRQLRHDAEEFGNDLYATAADLIDDFLAREASLFAREEAERARAERAEAILREIKVATRKHGVVTNEWYYATVDRVRNLARAALTGGASEEPA